MAIFLQNPFDMSPDAGDAPADALPFAANRRLFARAAVSWGARFITAASSHACVLLNISAGGARLRSSDPPEIGQRGRLIIDRYGSFDAEIVWVHNQQLGAGLRFSATPADVTRAFVQA